MKKTLLLLCLILALACPAAIAEESFPVLLFIGQDLGAVGGLADYSEGYVDAFPMPYGITTYTSLPSLDGLLTPADWGAGDVCAQSYVDDPAFEGVAMAIGLYFVGQESNLARGLHKTALERLGQFIAASGRTVYLRIGYEFDGAWNNYDPALYIQAFQNIVDSLRAQGVTNFETVWQSSGNGDARHLLQWYPGGDYVDWMGYSYFDGLTGLIGRGILSLAREHGKPVFIAEATPKRDVLRSDADLLWEQWYAPFLSHIERNRDVIGAVSYINCNWEAQRMWQSQGWGDSRLQASPELAERWQAVLDEGFFTLR